MNFPQQVTFIALIACVYSAPSPKAKPGVLAAPFVAAPAAYVTATSSQVIARNYNGLAAPVVAAPYVAAPAVAAAPYVAAPAVAAAPYVASPYVAAPARYAAYAAAPAVAPAYAPYYNPYAAAYAAPYAAAPVYL